MASSHYQPPPHGERSGSALCLSGGGFRAALFHLGSLRRLNEVGLLSRLTTISSVSGGSVASGLLAKVWPELQKTLDAKSGVFNGFLKLYEQRLRAFCGTDIRTGPLLWERLDPRHWWTLASHDHSATDFLAETYRDHLLGDLYLRDLAAVQRLPGPKFIINATDMQTGVNFEFSGERIGDYKIGYASAPDVLVAEAVAASSSFTIAFPPLVLKFDAGAFRGGWIEQHEPANPDLPKLRRRVVLSDGGVYDNLGLEPVWKTHQLVLCSNGGKPLDTQIDPGESPPSRLIRANGVIMNQADAVRKRWLVAAFENKLYHGAYWGIGTEIDGYPTHQAGYDKPVLDRLRAVRTDFDAFSGDEQLVLMNHGYLLTDAALQSYVTAELPKPLPAPQPPAPHLLVAQAALSALDKSDRRVWLGR
jgi:NTE family protein